MSLTVDLGKRIELVSMDPHFNEISIGLYRQNLDSGFEVVVHTYSQREGARERIAFIVRAMAILGGMEQLPGDYERLRFFSGTDLPKAARRVFLEACKCPSGTEVKVRPLSIFDKKSQSQVNVLSLGKGVYQVTMEAETDQAAKREPAIAAGLVKLSGAKLLDGHPPQLGFPDGQSKDALVGLLLIRALNVRAILREEEAATGRGVLSAPSAQKE